MGINPRHNLVDGSVTTQPEYSFWWQDVGFGMENYGTDPDIELEIRPQDHAVGKDTQLDRGIKEILSALRSHQPQLPDLTKRPPLPTSRLPQRKRKR